MQMRVIICIQNVCPSLIFFRLVSGSYMPSGKFLLRFAVVVALTTPLNTVYSISICNVFAFGAPISREASLWVHTVDSRSVNVAPSTHRLAALSPLSIRLLTAIGAKLVGPHGILQSY